MARFTTTGGSGDGTPGATGPQGPAGNDGPQGPQGETGPLPFTYQGDFDYGVTYGTNDAVTFNGGLWKLNNFIGAAGYAPTPGQWTLIIPAGEQGTQGEPGADGTNGTNGVDFGIYYLGNYNSESGYLPDIAVVRGSDGQLYLAKASGQLGDPIDYLSNGQWEVWIPKGADGAQGDPGPKGDQGDPGISGTTGLETWTRYSPVFQATGLTFTGSGATYPTYNSYYVKAGKLVSFVIEVDLSTVTNFGTDQYKLQLPFTPAFGYNHFSGWIWADPNVSPDTGTGHTILNADTAGVTDVLDLHYLKQSGGANSPIREGLFLQGTPVTLSTISNIYVNGTYIAQ